VLLLQHCADCGHVQYYQQAICRSVAAESRPSPGKRARQDPFLQRGASCTGPAFKADLPYAVLLIDLEEGPRMISTYTGGKPEDVAFDMDVVLVCERISEDVTLPRFRRA